MHDEDLEQLRRTLTDRPEDREAWGELAVELERRGRVPEWMSRARHLPVLLALLSARPDDRRPVGALAALLGLEPVTDPDLSELPWWRERAEHAGDHLFDRETGIPIRWRRRLDGAEMVLVPGGMREFPPWQSDIGRISMLDLPPMDELKAHTGHVLIDREPVGVGRVAAHRRALVGGDGWQGEGDAGVEGWPAEGIPWSEAVAYGEWVGARLPRFVELRRLGLTREAVEAFGVRLPERERFAEWVLDEIQVEGIRPAGPRQPSRVLLHSRGLEPQVVGIADSEVAAPGRGFRLVIELAPPPRDERPWDGYGPEEAVGPEGPSGPEDWVDLPGPDVVVHEDPGDGAPEES